MAARFHLSFCVNDLASTRSFYGELLRCPEGKATAKAVDFAFWGHQLTCHVAPEHVRSAKLFGLDGNHFGAIIPEGEFRRVATTLKAAGVPFLTEPTEQHAGTLKHRWKMVFVDPSGNAIELKAYKDEAQIFEGQGLSLEQTVR
jgi:extradiol dioxygenase family protein